MNELIAIERAYSGENFIGYRLTITGQRFLVWADQDILEGLRCGSEFVPGVGELIRYVPCEIAEVATAGNAI